MRGRFRQAQALEQGLSFGRGGELTAFIGHLGELQQRHLQAHQAVAQTEERFLHLGHLGGTGLEMVFARHGASPVTWSCHDHGLILERPAR